LRAAVLVALLCAPAFAELQNVTVGGQIHLRYNYWTSPAVGDSLYGRNPLFQPPWTQSFRGVPGGNPALGLRWPAQPGRFAVFSPVDWSDQGAKVSFVEQRTRLNVNADFTDEVSAFVELDSYDVWGEDFRSNYITGADARANTGDDVEVFQAYIQAKEMWGTPLQLRVGRQELNFGSGWLVGPNDTGSFFYGLSFDGVRATYATDQFSVDAWASKLFEANAAEEDGDTDFYGVYASYTGLEDITIDAYWMLVRDAASLNDTNRRWQGELVENWLGVDDYDATNLNTVGLRGAGKFGAFDFEAEAAYQFGSADSISRRFFAGAGLLSPYGDDDNEFDNWGANAQVGYTFDVSWSPRPFLGGAYLGGEDNRDLSFVDYLGARYCPFWHADPSVSFNRMFSNWQYSNWPDAPNQDISDLWLAYAGVAFTPCEAFTGIVSAACLETLNAYAAPWPTFNLFGLRYSPFARYSFLDKENDESLAWDVSLKGIYRYSDDLTFEAGWSHLFVDDGLSQGSFNIGNGLGFEGGTAKDDPDYFYVDTKLSF
jgi:hypothetical protein